MRQHDCKFYSLIYSHAAASLQQPFTFLTNFKISDFNKKYTSSLKMI